MKALLILTLLAVTACTNNHLDCITADCVVIKSYERKSTCEAGGKPYSVCEKNFDYDMSALHVKTKWQ